MAVVLPFVILLFALALVFQLDLFFTIVWFVLGLYALSRLWLRRSSSHMEVRRRFDDHAYTGDTVHVRLTVHNTGRLPIPWIEISESTPMDLLGTPFPSQALALGGHSERHFEYTLTCRRRGYYVLGPLRVETGDVLGMEERIFTVNEPRALTVYPRVVSLQELGLPTRSAQVTLPSRTPLFEDPTRIMGVRDYQPGDSIRRIHWSATARLGTMVVKQYQPAITRETLVCLHLDPAAYPLRRFEAIEGAIVVGASLASHMIVRERLPVGLAADARDPLYDDERRVSLPPRSQRAHLMHILEFLARVQPARTGNFARLLREESIGLNWGATLVAVTGTLDEELAETMLYLKRSGLALSLILVQPPSFPGGHHGVGNPGGVQRHRVWTDAEMAVMT